MRPHWRRYGCPALQRAARLWFGQAGAGWSSQAIKRPPRVQQGSRLSVGVGVHVRWEAEASVHVSHAGTARGLRFARQEGCHQAIQSQSDPALGLWLGQSPPHE